jgi:hypothetical protein
VVKSFGRRGRGTRRGCGPRPVGGGGAGGW